MCPRGKKRIFSAHLALLWMISCIKPSKSFESGVCTSLTWRKYPFLMETRRIPRTRKSPPSFRIRHIHMQVNQRPGDDLSKVWQDQRSALNSVWNDQKSVGTITLYMRDKFYVCNSSAPASWTSSAWKKTTWRVLYHYYEHSYTDCVPLCFVLCANWTCVC